MSTLAPPPPPPAPLPVAATELHQPLPPPPPEQRPGNAGASDLPRRELPLRLVSFFALAAFCAAHYSVLVSDANGRRVIGLVAIATAGGAALALTARLRGPRIARTALRIGIAIATFAAGLVVTGLQARLLLPGNWNEIADGLDRGFGGLDSFQWPYAGNDHWVRLTLLLGMPLLVIPAALLAFWPARRRSGALRALALALLLIAYGTGVAELGLGAWALRGSALLLVMAAWLWLPRMRPRDTVPATLAVLACGLLALPLAAGFDRDKPLVNYRSWNWFKEGAAGTAFQWDHSYGPITWSRSGTTLLQVKALRPHYWKAETLDRFDGVRWLHSRSPFQRGDAAADIPDSMNQRWVERISFTVRKLRSPLLVGAGTTFQAHVDKALSEEPDGTIRLLDPSLEDGDTYSVESYVPDPTGAQMRAAPDAYPQRLVSYTAFDLPRPGDSGLRVGDPSTQQRSELSSRRTIVPSFPNEPLSPQEEQRVVASPYGRTYALARRLARNQSTRYDTVKTIESYLRKTFDYSEKPPNRRYPLASFLFQDKIGYCQQFSGAMALMLRMNGIPSRVATGFTPGFYDYQAKEYRVRDLDAHSWVEVWFTGIGWVPFDPTPSLAPASSQSDSENAASAARGASADHGSTGATKATPSSDTTTASPSDSGDSGSRLWLLALVVVVLFAAAIGLLLAITALRRRPHFHGSAEEAVDELRAALRRLGHELPERTTLTELERRLRVTNGPSAARYVTLLRQHRYAQPGAARAPTPHDRRELRRALTAGGGPLRRLRGLLALPPHPRAR